MQLPATVVQALNFKPAYKLVTMLKLLYWISINGVLDAKLGSEAGSSIAQQGGSTMFKDFGRRLQRDLQKAVAARQPPGGRPVDVRVAGAQRFGVWFGGSVLGMMPHFGSMCCSRAEYQERGFRASVASNDGAA